MSVVEIVEIGGVRYIHDTEDGKLYAPDTQELVGILRADGEIDDDHDHDRYDIPSETPSLLALLLENAIPEGYDMVGGELVRQNKFGLSTDYDGYFGILPEGVFKYIFQIATEKMSGVVEWNKRLTPKNGNGATIATCSVGMLVANPNMSYCWNTGTIWWVVAKKSAKTTTLRRLETQVHKGEKDIGNNSRYWLGRVEFPENLPDATYYHTLTGEFKEEKQKRWGGVDADMKVTRRYSNIRPPKLACWKDLMFYDAPDNLADTWVYVDYTNSSTRALSRER